MSIYYVPGIYPDILWIDLILETILQTRNWLPHFAYGEIAAKEDSLSELTELLEGRSCLRYFCVIETQYPT